MILEFYNVERIMHTLNEEQAEKLLNDISSHQKNGWKKIINFMKK